MASWKDTLVKASDKKILPPRIFMYGAGGVGKSTWAAGMPGAVLIDYDHGAKEVKVDEVPGPETWEESLALIRSFAKDPDGCKSLCIDTVDVLAGQAEEFVVREAKTTFQKMNDAYGSGYQAVGVAWRTLLWELDEVRKKGINLLLLGHAVVRQAVDPQLGPFDQFTSQLPKTPWALTQRWADAVLFVAFDAERNVKEERAIVTGERYLFTVRGSGFEAKNRYNLERKMPLPYSGGWAAFEKAVAERRTTSAEIAERILKRAATPELLAKAKAFIASVDGDIVKLLAIEEGLLKAVPTESVPTTTGAPIPPPSPTDTTVTRILKMSMGTEHEAKARTYIEQAAGDLPKLLAIEAALKTKLAAASSPPPNGSAP
jgi:hypothetical protein